MRRRTCGDCDNLIKSGVLDCPIYGCSITGNMIPNITEGVKPYDKGEYVTTFYRIPLDCPLPDSEVIKSEMKAPKEFWVTINAKA